MNRFSERLGFKKPKSEIQQNDIDTVTRNSLWNVFHAYFKKGTVQVMEFPGELYLDEWLMEYLQSLWINLFKRPIDEAPINVEEVFSSFKKVILDSEWYEVYDFIEFTVDYFEEDELVSKINEVLKNELTGYRIINYKVTPITDEQEQEIIEGTLDSSKPFEEVYTHLSTALEKLSDRKTPDYRNSIKESISAIEALSNRIVGKKSKSLGQALKVVEEKMNIHPALKEGFSSLYGYTSQSDGIRHALLEEAVDIDFEDAHYFLITCSAFINYLIQKCEKYGINLD